MSSPAEKNVRTLKHLLLFALYIAALWSVTWYNFHYYSGAYNTIVTDFLLTAAFALAFFLPLVMPRRSVRKTAARSAALLSAAAVLALFLLQPHYTVADGYRILTDAHYQSVQLAQRAGVSLATKNHNPLVSTGILFEVEQGAHRHEVLFDPANGSYYTMT